mmetsp:Transcript_44953/g.95841  ORF Transcript_44953/g.95841 Transcript_44953/m.95841 type:complete len:255 (-) Transcript_44953:517-1281(-)
MPRVLRVRFPHDAGIRAFHVVKALVISTERPFGVAVCAIAQHSPIHVRILAHTREPSHHRHDLHLQTHCPRRTLDVLGQVHLRSWPCDAFHFDGLRCSEHPRLDSQALAHRLVAVAERVMAEHQKLVPLDWERHLLTILLEELHFAAFIVDQVHHADLATLHPSDVSRDEAFLDVVVHERLRLQPRLLCLAAEGHPHQARGAAHAVNVQVAFGHRRKHRTKIGQVSVARSQDVAWLCERVVVLKLQRLGCVVTA